MKKRIKIQSSLVFIFLILSVFLSKYFFARYKSRMADAFLDAVGTGILVSGFLFRISARGYKEDNTQGGHKLVMGGPYALIRNPMYFGTFLIGTGIILIILNWWTFPLFLAIYLSIYVPQILREKKVLSEMFGAQYTDYCKKVPACFPGFSSFLGGEVGAYLPLKWRWIKKELVSFVAVTVAITVIETWEDISAFGCKNLFKTVLEIPVIMAFFLAIIFIYYRKNGTKLE
jgi:protein-S-isoprenylcysteine O-methyltransferase Ste14